MASGYIYALINPSLAGMVKVGRTDRAPEDRARELSSATGVPTPFTVAYQRWVNDSISAEKSVHARLEGMGYRLSSNREFFSAPLHLVIDAILGVNDVEVPSSDLAGEDSDAPVWVDKLDTVKMLRSALKECGNDKRLFDKERAIRITQQLVGFGYINAYSILGEMLRSKTQGNDPKLAEKYFREGALKGSRICLYQLAILCQIYGRFEDADAYFKKAYPDTMGLLEEVMQDVILLEGGKVDQTKMGGDPLILDAMLGLFGIPTAFRYLRYYRSGEALDLSWINPASLDWCMPSVAQGFAFLKQESPSMVTELDMVIEELVAGIGLLENS